jgi:hypothetical protein
MRFAYFVALKNRGKQVNQSVTQLIPKSREKYLAKFLH